MASSCAFLSSISPTSGIAYCKCSVHSLYARRQRLAETHTFRTKRIENPRTPSQLSASPMRMGISLQKHQHAMMYQLLQKHVQPGGSQTFQPCSFANCSQAYTHTQKCQSLAAGRTGTFRGNRGASIPLRACPPSVQSPSTCCFHSL